MPKIRAFLNPKFWDCNDFQHYLFVLFMLFFYSAFMVFSMFIVIDNIVYDMKISIVITTIVLLCIMSFSLFLLYKNHLCLSFASFMLAILGYLLIILLHFGKFNYFYLTIILFASLSYFSCPKKQQKEIYILVLLSLLFAAYYLFDFAYPSSINIILIFSIYLIFFLLIYKYYDELHDQFEAYMQRSAQTEELDRKIYSNDDLIQYLNKHILNLKINHKSLFLTKFSLDFLNRIDDLYGEDYSNEIISKILVIIQERLSKLNYRNILFSADRGSYYIIILNINSNQAFSIANNFRMVIKNTKFVELLRITCSFGIAKMQIEDNANKILYKADKFLFVAQKLGGNRVLQDQIKRVVNAEFNS